MTYSIFYSTKALELFCGAVAALALLLAWVVPQAGAHGFRALEKAFAGLSKRTAAAATASALLPMIFRLVLLPWFPIPQPHVHDEFSYLLLGDTLAHGRLANPTPPLWEHFETEYELMTPVYASQYQPAQGVFLAAGELITGVPWWGVWLSCGLMCGAACWALSGIVSRRWALFGAVLMAFQIGVFGFWMNSYFGGAVSAVGGSFVFGSLTRLKRKRSRRTLHAITAGMGLVILLASRPAEALIWMTFTAIWLFRDAPLRRAGIHTTLIVACGVSALGVYNKAITGHAAEMPYSLYRDMYGTPQSYWWQAPVIISRFRTPEVAANYRDQLALWRRRSSIAALWDAEWRRLRDFWRFFIGPFSTPALFLFPMVVRRRKTWPWLGLSAVLVLDHATYHAWYPQQSGGETILITWLLVECWRQLRATSRLRQRGLAATRLLMAGFACALLLLTFAIALQPGARTLGGTAGRVLAAVLTQPGRRAQAIHRLEQIPGGHLVFVERRPGHPWYDEWVFNPADLSGSRIVFARMCSPESDLRLVRALPHRTVWLANPDSDHPLKRMGADASLNSSLAAIYGIGQIAR